ncbi:hypothetical protein HMPREF0156_01568 [Bacteroidetes oral taxon 274 str. F0058]|nr:hypothetical protein HMPREF0156_01568 [Bacteroidetes oral taxon 274 str. F0058]
MKKIFLFTILLAASSEVFAQENEKVLPQRELQIEIGEALNLWYLISPESPNQYSVDRCIFPAFSLTYNHKINQKWWYGISAIYNYNREELFDNKDSYHLSVYRSNNHVFAAAPAIKFIYCNTETLQMYSGLQAGISLITVKIIRSKGEVSNGTNIGFWGQLIAFGINYGKDFYIGAEAGFGYKGMLNLTAGYRF